MRKTWLLHNVGLGLVKGFTSLALFAFMGLTSQLACSGGSGGPGDPPPAVAPAFAVQPQSQTVTAGAAATFTVAATASPATDVLAYQWQVNKGAGFLPAGAGDGSGTSSASFTTVLVTTAMSGEAFQCLVTDTTNGRSATSSTATLTVTSAPPAITGQPQNQSVLVGAAALFTVTASASPATDGLAYQWQVNKGAGFIAAGAGEGTGASSANFTTVPAALVMNGYVFQCVVTDATNGRSVTSLPATLSVSPIPVPPTITTNPVDRIVTAGAQTAFTVAANATPPADPLAYQWKKTLGGATSNVTGQDGSGATAATFTTVATTVGMSGTAFFCVVTDTANGLSATTASALLTVNPVAPPGPLKVVGRFLQDANGSDVMMRGVDVPVFKSGYADDLDAVAAAVATTQANVVRLEWWAVPPAGTTQYATANLDRALQKYADLGILPIVSLWDLTFQFGHDDKAGLNSDGNSQALFAATITAYWTRPDVLAVLVKHQNHIVINLANEWGSSTYSDATSTAANFIQNYTTAITALRNAGIRAPLMVDAPKGFEYQFVLDHGQAILNADPQSNTMLSIHAYWAAVDYADPVVQAVLDGIMGSGLPIILGEASSNAYTAIPCDPIHYASLLTRANINRVGYLFWAWYEDGQCGQNMNITVGQDGVTVPTAANPGFGYDALQGAGYGINTANPPTTKIVFH